MTGNDACNGNYYVYVWFGVKNGLPVPFYVGSSKNESRLNDKYSRCKQFKEFLNECENYYSKKVSENLSFEEAMLLEYIIKAGIKATGYDIIDAETDMVERRRRIMAARETMPIIDGRQTSLKTGRPCGKPSARDYVDMDRFYELYSEVKSKKRSNASAARELGIGYTTWYRLVDYVKYPDGNSPHSYNRKGKAKKNG